MRSINIFLYQPNRIISEKKIIAPYHSWTQTKPSLTIFKENYTPQPSDIYQR